MLASTAPCRGHVAHVAMTSFRDTFASLSSSDEGSPASEASISDLFVLLQREGLMQSSPRMLPTPEMQMAPKVCPFLLDRPPRVLRLLDLRLLPLNR